MTTASDLASGKGHTDENFPVASILIHPRHRPAILAYYRFARAADDISDNATAKAEEKLRLLDQMQKSLSGGDDVVPEAVALREIAAELNLTTQHASDLLEAFRRDVVKLRYASWDELMDYCRYSAMPVGRFMLDVHGESHDTWPASDALCAALQVINHLQDCGKDYRSLNRVYIPLDLMAAVNVTPEALGEPKASSVLLAIIRQLGGRTTGLLANSKPLADQIVDTRLALEVAVIQRLAENLNNGLLKRDPLSDRVHHSKPEALGLALLTTAGFLIRRRRPKKAASQLATHP
ncbi:MAG TPA: squalene synthase HpnC [Rhizomicrobium sp.]|nr:squalene synthase HpnC [Rhizomicrobium sp.]